MTTDQDPSAKSAIPMEPASGGSEGSGPATLPADASAGNLLDAVLKRPEQLIERLAVGDSLQVTLRCLLVAMVFWVLYGLVVGSFSGGMQWWAAPLKLVGGALAVSILCLPSLFIFGSLAGADMRPGQAVAIAAMMAMMTTLLLVGFLPVAWVFSQSTSSLFFIGLLHGLFWYVGVHFSRGLLDRMLRRLGATRGAFIRTWGIVFLLTSLQMSTALRPIIGTADTFVVREKQFFLSHWLQVLSSELKASVPQR